MKLYPCIECRHNVHKDVSVMVEEFPLYWYEVEWGFEIVLQDSLIFLCEDCEDTWRHNASFLKVKDGFDGMGSVTCLE